MSVCFPHCISGSNSVRSLCLCSDATGRQYYSYGSNRLDPGYPQPLTRLGLPADIDRIDAALVWSYNNRTFLYSGSEYWRCSEDERSVEVDYPRTMDGIWKGVGFNIDSAFQNVDGEWWTRTHLNSNRVVTFKPLLSIHLQVAPTSSRIRATGCSTTTR